ncbi:MAG: tetratricopeptide repeat protein [Saprospiraceae bacterium]|nr:tetratricopeptide repeat protein [Saprospiraceae bacterium]
MRILISFLSTVCLFTACTPKTVEKTVETGIPEKYKSDESDVIRDGCTTFSTSEYPEDALNEHVIYRGFLRENDFDSAWPHWQRAFQLAPAADGKRSTQYTDGVKFYKHFFNTAKDSVVQAEYVQKIRDLYRDAAICYPNDYFLNGLLAFDLYYTFRSYSSDEEIYSLFKSTIDQDGLKTPAFVLNPFTDVLIARFNRNEVSVKEAQHYQDQVRKILAHGLTDSKEKENFSIVKSYAPVRLEEFETIEDFYPTQYYVDRYYPDYLADSTNCDVAETVYSRLRWGKLNPNDARLVRMGIFIKNKCTEADQTSTGRKAFDALQEGRYREAVDLFEKASAESGDNSKKAQYQLVIAKVYYSHLKNFNKSRQYALASAKLDPNNGEPYILIGKLYASSGPICGPGRGWDSQIVTWPAIDKWQVARNIDPSVAAEATRLINQYSAYMPNVEDIFQRNLKEGQSFYVGCWIQESTTIRTAK